MNRSDGLLHSTGMRNLRISHNQKGEKVGYSWNSDVNELTKPDDLEEFEDVFDWEKLRSAVREVLPLLFSFSNLGHRCKTKDVGAIMRALGETEEFYGDIEDFDLETMLHGLLAARAMCPMHKSATAAVMCIGYASGDVNMAGVLACVRQA